MLFSEESQDGKTINKKNLNTKREFKRKSDSNNNPTARQINTEKTKVKPRTVNRAPAIKRKAVSRPSVKKPTSFTSTPVYKNREPEPDIVSEDDYYYDDGQDAIEIDPVRKVISKETFDPESVGQDSYIEEDVYMDNSEGLNDAKSEIIAAEDIWGDGSSKTKEKEQGSTEDNPYPNDY